MVSQTIVKFLCRPGKSTRALRRRTSTNHLRVLSAAGILCVALLNGTAVAQSRPANDAELAQIRSNQSFFLSEDGRQLTILHVDGHVIDNQVAGSIWYRPIPAPGGLCQLIRRHVAGETAEARLVNLLVNPLTLEFRYWVAATPGDCDIDDIAALPTDAVTVPVLLPTAALARILRDSDALLLAAIDHGMAPGNRHQASTHDEHEVWLERLEHFRADPDLVLTEVSLAWDWAPDYGRTYLAQFLNPDLGEGPAVAFSIEGGTTFRIHTVGFARLLR